MATPTRLMTFAEFERLPEPRGAGHELRHGELFILAPPLHEQSITARRFRSNARPLIEPAGL